MGASRRITREGGCNLLTKSAKSPEAIENDRFAATDDTTVGWREVALGNPARNEDVIRIQPFRPRRGGELLVRAIWQSGSLFAERQQITGAETVRLPALNHYEYAYCGWAPLYMVRIAVIY